jgi:hydroxymethylpyrimidine pyrophosphatase-like HAD family hydrolase
VTALICKSARFGSSEQMIDPETAAALYDTAQTDGAMPESAFAHGEGAFYRKYDWALNIYPRVADSFERLREELNQCTQEAPDWRRREMLTNIFLHCCAVADTVDDFLLGRSYDLSKVALIPFSGPAISAFDRYMNMSRALRHGRFVSVHRWRRKWHGVLREFLGSSLIADVTPSIAQIQRLYSLSEKELPSELLAQVAKVPAAFCSQDMSHHDVMLLGRKFVEGTIDQRQGILVVGLRTAGSYFAPLLAAYLCANGFRDVDWVTIRPKRGISAWEQERLSAYSRKAGRAVIIDEPVNTGKTLLKTIDLLGRSGFRDRITVLVPVHPSRRDWIAAWELEVLHRHQIIRLEPEDWHKRALMRQDSFSSLMSRWLGGDGKFTVSVTLDQKANTFNRKLEETSEKKFHNRLKQVYRVDASCAGYPARTRYVLAKSVGWGWYGYHAVLVSERLRRFVPPLIGFRDGIVFQEWVTENSSDAQADRQHFVQRAADYISRRSQVLRLDRDPVKALAADNRHKAVDELSSILSRAYGSKPASLLRRAELRDRLTATDHPFATLVDGKMRPLEWVNASGVWMKTDFEHHGLGKTELNAVDPAYDLAETILQWRLSAEDERQLVARYVSNTGDWLVHKRLHLQKLLVGTWEMMRALDNLADARLAHRASEFNRAYIDAWTFLIVHTSKFTADLCMPKPMPYWHQPLVVMDIDGVLDKQIFGFPSTTAAGIRGISLLHAHDFPLAVNTARSVMEVKEYCKAYSMVGGVAEYGAFVWDAISGKEQGLLSSASLEQLNVVSRELRKIPGVFLNDDYKYSVRAFTYHRGVTVALPTMMIQNLIASLKLDRLTFHQTFLDTAVVSKETDKGRGMIAMLELAGQPKAPTIAIGDSEPDLPMFAAATRSYAPAHIACKQSARMLGCALGNGTYQVGLLDIVRRIVHDDGRRCARCTACERLLSNNSDLFVEMLKIADLGRISSLAKAIVSRRVLSAFRQ